MEKLVSLTMKELSRYEVIQRLINGEINGTEASKQLNLTVRHIRRVKKKVKDKGAVGLAHGNRGKPSNRSIDSEIEKQALENIKKKYPDFGPTLVSEKLEEIHSIKLSIEKIRQLMLKENLWKPKQRKKNKQHRTWRQRKENYGEMQQFDGSYHHWFENRAPECCLLASIDDATGKITKAVFDENESVISVFSFWKEYLKKKGKPTSIYLDKYSTYKINHKSAVDNSELLTKFQKAAKELNIKLITAHSPEAKGRIERLFETLQDRLVKELRLRGINDKATANRFLEDEFIPWFNNKFGVIPAKKSNLHSRINREERKQIDSILSIQSQRRINNDFTVRFKNKWFQLGQIQPTLVLKRDTVVIEERTDGTVYLKLRDKYLNYAVLPERPQKIIMKQCALARTKTPWTPPKDHPWRKPFPFEKQSHAFKKQKVVLKA